MAVGDAQALAAAKAALDGQKLPFIETDEQYVTKLTVSHGIHKAVLRVSSKGALDVQGAESALKAHLQQIKAALESGCPLPGQLLADINQLGQSLRQTVPNCDPVILAFIDEAVRCYQADALLACAFLLGAASEKAMGLLFQRFGDCMVDSGHKAKYESKINNRMISVCYEEFSARFRACKSRPTTAPLSQDIDTLLGTAFQFYRMTRNGVGHPEVVPGIDKAVLHANIAQIVVYIERIYALMDHFKAQGVVL